MQVTRGFVDYRKIALAGNACTYLPTLILWQDPGSWIFPRRRGGGSPLCTPSDQLEPTLEAKLEVGGTRDPQIGGSIAVMITRLWPRSRYPQRQPVSVDNRNGSRANIPGGTKGEILSHSGGLTKRTLGTSSFRLSLN